MAEAADAEDGDEVARPRAGVAEGIEGRDARAHERSGLGGREPVGDAGEHLPGRDDVVGVAAVVRDAGDCRPLRQVR